MPIQISKTLVSKLPPDDQADLADFLSQKAGGVCALCAGKMNEAAEALVADHDTPESEGGPNTRSNLQLVHKSCNAAKRNTPSIDVRPLLRLQRFIRERGGIVKYDDVLDHFGVTPAPTAVRRIDDRVEFSFSDGSSREVEVIRETTPARVYDVAFIDVPQVALFNDTACQPRQLKIPQVTAIYGDLRKNPLHEAPGCRVETTGSGNMVRLLMFDGQHKSVAMWLSGQKRITVKVYLDLKKDEAIVLVNSVQAKIKKLPLSPFELSAKLADEWELKLTSYEAEVGSADASEAGFIKWLDASDRTRGKQALAAAIVQDVLEDDQLLFRSLLHARGNEPPLMTEATFRNKVLGELLHLAPIEEKGDRMNAMRLAERATAVRVLNLLAQTVFSGDAGDQGPHFELRRKRMSYQSAISRVSALLRSIIGRETASEAPLELLKRQPDEHEWAKIEAAVRRIADHPIWTADLARNAKCKAFADALQKNQNIEKAMESVRLDLGYAVGVRAFKTEDLDD